jgi:hypothetical protein
VEANRLVSVALATLLSMASEAVALELCARVRDAEDGEVRTGSLVRVRESCNDSELRLDPEEMAPAAPAHAVWRDAADRVVGPYSAGEILLQEEGRVFRLDVDPETGDFLRDDHPPSFAFYEAAECQGTPLLPPAPRPVITKAFVLTHSGMKAFFLPEEGVPTVVRSFWDGAFLMCTPLSLTVTAAPAAVLDLSSFQEPFRLALE